MRSTGTPLVNSASSAANPSVTYDLRRSPPKTLTELVKLLRSADAQLPLASPRAALENIALDAV